MIIAQGGRFGGWALYVKDGKAKFVYNVLGIQEFATEADQPIPAGTHQVRMEFAYDGGGLAKGGDVTLFYDGEPVGSGRVGATQPMVFSADETTDIGYESGTTVTPDYTAHDQPVHRQDPLGADRPRQRRPRPLHRPRGAPPHRHGPAVGPAPSSGRARPQADPTAAARAASLALDLRLSLSFSTAVHRGHGRLAPSVSASGRHAGDSTWHSAGSGASPSAAARTRCLTLGSIGHTNQSVSDTGITVPGTS